MQTQITQCQCRLVIVITLPKIHAEEISCSRTYEVQTNQEDFIQNAIIFRQSLSAYSIYTDFFHSFFHSLIVNTHNYYIYHKM